VEALEALLDDADQQHLIRAGIGGQRLRAGPRVGFADDVMMPYQGAPFFAEGSPDGLLGALALIADIGSRLLVHGHTTLTEQFTVDAVPGLLAALTELRDRSLAGIGHGLTLTRLLKASVLPDVLREHPAAVGPYLVIRDHFVQRLYHQHSGYWQPDEQGPGMVIGMAAKKVTVTLEETQLDRIRALVAAGTAASVSGFVQHAVGVALDDVAGWGALLAQALRETGGALSDSERAWADEVLGIGGRSAA